MLLAWGRVLLVFKVRVFHLKLGSHAGLVSWRASRWRKLMGVGSCPQKFEQTCQFNLNNCLLDHLLSGPTKTPFLFSINRETASSEVHKSYCTLSRGAMNKTFRGLPWTRPNRHRMPVTKNCSFSQLWLVRHQYTNSKAKTNRNISRVLLYYNTHPSQVNFLSNPPHFKDVFVGDQSILPKSSPQVSSAHVQRRGCSRRDWWTINLIRSHTSKNGSPFPIHCAWTRIESVSNYFVCCIHTKPCVLTPFPETFTGVQVSVCWPCMQCIRTHPTETHRNICDSTNPSTDSIHIFFSWWKI